MGVEAQIRLQVDRLAKGRQNSLSNYATGTTFWALVDAAADIAYENRVKGADIYAMDQALSAGSVWVTSALRKFFELHHAYFAQDLSLSPGTFDTYFSNTAGWAAPWEFAEAYFEANGQRLSKQNVFPKGTLPGLADSDPSSAGLHKITRLTGTAGTPTQTDSSGAIDTTKMIGAPILIVNVDATPAPSSLVITFTRQDGTTYDWTVSLGGTTQYKWTTIAQAVNTGGAAAGQKVVPAAATALFKAGEYVLLYEGDTNQEIVQIDTISANTSLTMKSNLKKSYTTSGLIYPLFTDADYKSGTLGNSKSLDIYAYPHRTIAL